MQEFLPNTYPAGAVNPCPSCPWASLISPQMAIPPSRSVTAAPTAANGFTASLQYTYAKSIDDSALSGRNQGGQLIAQNWST